jgi:hypothetical protein
MPWSHVGNTRGGYMLLLYSVQSMFRHVFTVNERLLWSSKWVRRGGRDCSAKLALSRLRGYWVVLVGTPRWTKQLICSTAPLVYLYACSHVLVHCTCAKCLQQDQSVMWFNGGLCAAPDCRRSQSRVWIRFPLHSLPAVIENSLISQSGSYQVQVLLIEVIQLKWVRYISFCSPRGLH